MSIGLLRDQLAGSTLSSFATVSSPSGASRPPELIRSSTASTPAPPPLVTINSSLPWTGFRQVSVSAAANSSSSSSTRTRPARRNAAPTAASLPASAPVCVAAARADFLVAARLDHDHRLGACRRSCRRHELARGRDGLEIEQDRAGGDVGGEEVEQVADIDIGHVAHGDHIGEADVARRGPIEDAGDERARLRQEGELAGGGAAEPEIGMQADARHGDAETIRADDAQAIGARGVERRLFDLRRQPRRDGDHGAGSLGAELLDQRRHRGRWRRDHRKFRRFRQRRDVGKTFLSADLGLVGVDEIDRPGEAAGENVLGQDLADRARLSAGADNGDGMRAKRMIEIADCH